MSRNSKAKGRPSKWTDELIEQLLKLWEEGLSASDIANALGQGFSRNAVIGKVHRLRAAGKAPARRDTDKRSGKRAGNDGGASRRKTALAAPASAGAATGKGGQALAVQRQEAPRAAAATAPQNQLKVASVEEGLVKDIMDLKHHSCRWPIGTPGEEGFSYCGRKAADGGPYCAHHAAVAYTTTTNQKRAAG